MTELKQHEKKQDHLLILNSLMATLPTEPILRGRNIILRPMCAEDTELFLRMRNHPEVQKWFIYRNDITEAEHMEWIAKHLVQGGDSKQFMIYAPQEDGFTDHVIGCTNLKNIDFLEKKAEYGLFIADPSVRGKGYGAETVALMAKYAFDKIGLESVFSRVYTNNVPSVKHLEREGFEIIKEEKAVVSTDGTRADMYLMELHK